MCYCRFEIDYSSDTSTNTDDSDKEDYEDNKEQTEDAGFSGTEEL